ncbi:MAG: DNA-deoxyinosine glycosylase [Lachnospiraceae bacterium]|nr:DNA-deoxyinosine glycosylase [Lachnospiraceae bacterium]
MESLNHTFAPVFDENSRILILGTFPSVKSRENNFYYGHPQNRFWKVTAALTGSPVPETIEEKKAMLLAGRIAVWDVIASCEIEGSSDSSIRNVVPNDIAGLLAKNGIRAVFCNGGKAYELYVKYCEKQCGIKAIKLPSTSPANAAWSLQRLTESWRAETTAYLI